MSTNKLQSAINYIDEVISDRFNDLYDDAQQCEDAYEMATVATIHEVFNEINWTAHKARFEKNYDDAVELIEEMEDA